MNKAYKRGSKLMIELNSGDIYEGTYGSSTDDLIIFENVCQYPSGEKYEYQCTFYITEILSIKKISDDDTTKTINKEETSVFNKYEELKKLAHNYIYVAVVDNNYFEAIKHINLLDSITVVGQGSTFGRNSKISVLGIGTKTQIYLFDLKLSGERAIDMGLKGILESDDITKITHKSKTLSDCLYHSHKVKLKNVFDTQVAALMCDKMEKKEVSSLKSLAESLSVHLNLPANILNVVEPNAKHLVKRPLSDEIKIDTALKVAYLYHLKRCLEKKIFHKYYCNVDKYVKCMRDATPTESLQLLDDNDVTMFTDLV